MQPNKSDVAARCIAVHGSYRAAHRLTGTADGHPDIAQGARRAIKTALVPPKANEFDMTTRIRACARAWFGT